MERADQQHRVAIAVQRERLKIGNAFGEFLDQVRDAAGQGERLDQLVAAPGRGIICADKMQSQPARELRVLHLQIRDRAKQHACDRIHLRPHRTDVNPPDKLTRAREDSMPNGVFAGELVILRRRPERQDREHRRIETGIALRQRVGISRGHCDDVVGRSECNAFQPARQKPIQPIFPPFSRHGLACVRQRAGIPGIMKIVDDLASIAPPPQRAEDETQEHRRRKEHDIITFGPQQPATGAI